MAVSPKGPISVQTALATNVEKDQPSQGMPPGPGVPWSAHGDTGPEPQTEATIGVVTAMD